MVTNNGQIYALHIKKLPISLLTFKSGAEYPSTEDDWS